ncbi:Fungalysin metallopeptidase-domain-containing protein [Irpex rosettiformis]|uniref:Fungalysin metallopeptidase-domain-containing protein n=1 Tax=Irpex rosettiformis TaxID=378272 RepID=A0ACB8U121_9APHY|nr:Fungalysin metallopeptidase-domain-containing protein [Irpex rosettiformis]
MFSRKFFASILLAVAYASSAIAAPWPANSKHATHQVREFNNLRVVSYHPEVSYETFEAGIDHPLQKRATENLEDASVSAVHSRLGLGSDDVTFKSGYSAETANLGYVRQQINGVPVANAVANVAFNKDDKLVAFGHSFVKPKNVAPADPTLSREDAISKAETALAGKYNDWPTGLEYVVQEDGSLKLAHVIQIRDEAKSLWVEAFVDAHSGEVIQLTDFVNKASYYVLPITKEYPTEGLSLITNPQDTTASLNGWHDSTTTLTTAGNNAVAYKGSTSSTSSQSGSGTFNYPPALSSSPTTTANVNAARVNAFYVVNTIHDISYKYGFTESAYNFQTNNNGKGGKGNDRVTVQVQNPSYLDNADFSTPPDGQSGHMNMYLWDFTGPGRDGAIENDIIAHENTHGISNRLTGGGTGRCLQSLEAGGMGEGWSDAFANWLHQGSTTADYILGQWVTGNNGGGDNGGIRSHPYSTSATTNPLRYSSIAALNEVHNIGEVWANLLHNVYASLVSAHGWSATARTDPTGSEGNVVFLHLFIDSLALQPCSPTFTTARDAWIQADANRYGGANKCLLWKAFASRGLGVNAKNHVDDSTVPSGC